MKKPKKVNEPGKNLQVDSRVLIGLDALKKTLERDFFAETTIECSWPDESNVDLIVHLSCNFGLTGSLFHLNNGNWGGFDHHTLGNLKVSSLQTALYAINEDNSCTIDIKEFSIHLADISIVISRIPHLSIMDHLEDILIALSANFVHFTKGLIQMPYEIFVPIFEEPQNTPSSEPYADLTKSGSNYFDFWGLYFEDCDDALIYDVNNKEIVDQSDFFLLNELH